MACISQTATRERYSHHGSGNQPASLRLRGLRQLLQGAPPAGAARATVRPNPDRHLRRRHAHRRVRTHQPLPLDPVLEIAPDRYLLESNAILVYLAHGTPLLPTGAIEQAEVVRWLILEQTDLIPAIAGLRFRLQTGRIASDDADAMRRRTAGEELLGILDDHLSGREFLVADRYTIADIAVYGYTHVAARSRIRPRPLARSPRLARSHRRAARLRQRSPPLSAERPGRGRSLDLRPLISTPVVSGRDRRLAGQPERVAPRAAAALVLDLDPRPAPELRELEAGAGE